MASGTIPYPTQAVYFLTADYDLNNPPTNFCFLQVSENTVNTPSQVSGRYKRGIVINCPYTGNDSYIGQMFISQTSSSNPYVFVRGKEGATWGDWKQLAFAS